METSLDTVKDTSANLIEQTQNLAEKALDVIEEHPVATAAVATAAIATAATCAYIAHENRLVAEKAIENGAIEKIGENGGFLKTGLTGVDISVSTKE